MELETTHSLLISVGQEPRLCLAGSSAQRWTQEINQAWFSSGVQSSLPTSFWCWPNLGPCFLAGSWRLTPLSSPKPQLSAPSSHPHTSVFPLEDSLCQTHHVLTQSPQKWCCILFPGLFAFKERCCMRWRHWGWGSWDQFGILPTTVRRRSTCHSSFPPSKGH